MTSRLFAVAQKGAPIIVDRMIEYAASKGTTYDPPVKMMVAAAPPPESTLRKAADAGIALTHVYVTILPSISFIFWVAHALARALALAHSHAHAHAHAYSHAHETRDTRLHRTAAAVLPSR